MSCVTSSFARSATSPAPRSPTDSSLCRAAARRAINCCSPFASALQLLLAACVRFSCCSPRDCIIRFNCCSPFASALQLLLAACVRFSCCSRLQLLLPDCVRFDCCSPPAVLEHSSQSESVNWSTKVASRVTSLVPASHEHPTSVIH